MGAGAGNTLVSAPVTSKDTVLAEKVEAQQPHSSLLLRLCALIGWLVSIAFIIALGVVAARKAKTTTTSSPSSPAPAPPVPHQPSSVTTSGMMHYLAANASTTHWGFYSPTLTPSITIASGDTITVEMLTHHAGDYYDGMIAGDAAMMGIYNWGIINGVPLNGSAPGNTPATLMRGPTGQGDGSHILTGPIAVAGAVPGDVIAVKILALRPRVNPNTGKSFGVNAATWFGYPHGWNGPKATNAKLVGYATNFGNSANTMNYTQGANGAPATVPPVYTGSLGLYQREVTTVYEIVKNAAGAPVYASPFMQFQYGLNGSITTPCLMQMTATANNSYKPSALITVPCVNGVQTWTGYNFVGLITDHSKTTKFAVANKWQVPVNFHIGNMALAQASPAFVESIPPMVGGGNLDNRRIGVGATMYYKVQVNGGLLSMGDAHTAQGDSELDGTGMETSINADLQITLIKNGSPNPSGTLPAGALSNLNFPLLENDNEFNVHGFTYVNYLDDLGYSNTACSGLAFPQLGGNATYNPLGCRVSKYGANSAVEPAMANAHKNARNFLMSLGFDEDAATSIVTLTSDFSVSQVVDGNWGVHVSIPKYALAVASAPSTYSQVTTCGGSIPATAVKTAPLAAITPTAYLAANASTIRWGYYSNTVAPAITVNSGDTITIEMLSHHAGDYYAGMIAGDPGVMDVYAIGSAGPGLGASLDPANSTSTPRSYLVPGSAKVPNAVGTYMRGASGAGDGVHILTGPVAVAGAVPGDVIQVDILALRPRINPATGKTYGINAAAWWGYNYGVNSPLARNPGASNGWTGATLPTAFPTSKTLGYLTGDPDREIANVYEIVNDATGAPSYATPAFRFKYGSPGSVVVPCIGNVSNTAPVLNFNPGISVACVNGFQNFTGYQYPGLITNHPTGTEDYSVAGKWKVPINFHIGSMGLAPASPAFVDSVPPRTTGGNIDDRRMGVGATMYFKVAVNGGLLSMGDAHTAQGDSELSGTGIETHITGDFRLTLIKSGAANPSGSLPAQLLTTLNYPLLENANEFVVHGFTYTDYLASLSYNVTTCDGTAFPGLGGTTTYNPLGCPTASIYANSRTDDAVANTVHQAIFFLQYFGFTEDMAHTILTTAADLGITQVVDGNFGAHYVIPKYVLSGNQTAAYTQATLCKTSTPASSYTAAYPLTGGMSATSSSMMMMK